MGRSVSTPPRAQIVAYAHLETVDFPEWEDFCELVNDYRATLKAMWPSLEREDSWLGCEDRVVADNAFAWFGLSEYCGLVAYWVVPKTEWLEPEPEANLCAHWVEQIRPRFEKAFGTLRKVATFSNGESMFERRSA